MEDRSILTVREVAGLLKVDQKTVYRLARDKRLPGFKVAGSWRFKQVDIDTWIEEQKEVAGTDSRKKGRKKR